MAIKFQYNKTFVQSLGKDLKIRETALPTLQAKEAALRLEVKKARADVSNLEKEINDILASLETTYRLWCEFPELLSVSNVEIETKGIAGVKVPVLKAVSFEQRDFSLHANPNWFAVGLDILRAIAELKIKKQLASKKLEILEYARKKTTQKVNLYEKVQIPEIKDILLKIKRYLEDEENLAKSSQKILKTKLEREAA